MKKSTRIAFGSIVLVLSVLGVGFGIAWLKYMQIVAAMSAPPPPEAPVAVKLGKAVPCSIRQSTTSVGTIMAPRSITIRTETSGLVSRIGIESGGLVKEGSVILELDASVEKAQLESAKARQKIAASTFERLKQASDAKAVSELELEQAQAELDQAVAEIDRNEAIIARKTIFAPFDARVGLINTFEGQYLSEGTVIGTLQSVEEFVHVDFELPEAVSFFVQEGHEIQLRVGDQTFTAKIVARDSQADRITRNLLARARLNNPPAALLPNVSVKVFIEYGPELQALLVPLTSVRRSPTGAYVFVTMTDPEGKLRVDERRVKVGKTIAEGVIVMEGLEADEQVVADGSFKLREGAMIVEIPDDASSSDATQAAESSQSGKPDDKSVAEPKAVVEPSPVGESTSQSGTVP